MRRQESCAEQHESPSNITKYCACHAKWDSKQKAAEKITYSTRPFREWSLHDPTMTREWSDHEPVSPQPALQLNLLFALAMHIFRKKNTAFRAPAIIPDFIQILPLPQKVTVQLHQILPLPRKIIVQHDCNFTNIVPAAKNEKCHSKSGNSNTILWLY